MLCRRWVKWWSGGEQVDGVLGGWRRGLGGRVGGRGGRVACGWVGFLGVFGGGGSGGGAWREGGGS